MPTVLVTGANRGIGLEFARQYAAAGWDVIATVRSEAGALEELGVRIEHLDLRDFAAVGAFAASLAGQPLDLFIANAGMTAARRIDSAREAESAVEVLAVNSVAPTLLAELLAPNVAAARGKIVAMSSRMGSIGDSSGDYLAYRASKAALNAAWYALSKDLTPRGITLALFHPGWVQTDMGGPNAQVSPARSVDGMRRIIEALTPEDSGVFIDYEGKPIPW